MSLTHCPLCVGLALLSVVRAAGHLSLLVLLVRPLRSVALQPAPGPSPCPQPAWPQPF